MKTDIDIDASLPTCYPDQPTAISHGYWMKDVWKSSICKTTQWTSVSHVQICLRNKQLLLLGDSTVRQWAEYIPVLLNATGARPRNATDNTEYHHFHREYQDINLTVSFRFHAYPITVVRTPPLLHEVDIIDTITSDKCLYIILVLSPWAHFSQWTRESYHERLALLRKSVERLRERCPGVPVVLKEPHPRDYPDLLSRIYASDYLLQEIGKDMRENIPWKWRLVPRCLGYDIISS